MIPAATENECRIWYTCVIYLKVTDVLAKPSRPIVLHGVTCVRPAPAVGAVCSRDRSLSVRVLVFIFGVKCGDITSYLF